MSRRPWKQPGLTQEKPKSEIMKPGEVGEYLKIAPDTVSKLASKKIIPGFKVGKQWRFKRVEIENYIST